MAGVLVAATPGGASASACASCWTEFQTVNPSPHYNVLHGAAVLSPSSAWAVGRYRNGTTLIEHWNGTSWKHVSSPNPSHVNILNGVAASSATDIWAVGFYANADNGTGQTLTEHWNGTRWAQVPSPSPDGDSSLGGVAATSASNAWAVGSYDNGTTGQPLIEHWNGTSWRHQLSPNPGGSDNYLYALAATSSSNAWGVGGTYSDNVIDTLAVHCC